MNKHGAGNPELGIVQGLSPAPWLSLHPGAGWVVECMPRPGPHKGQHFINTQQPSKHLIHLLFPGFALLDNRGSVLGRESDGSVSRNNCSGLTCGRNSAHQGLHTLWGHFHRWERAFLTQVNCGLFHCVKLLHLNSLRLRKGLFDYYEVEKTEQKGRFTV